MTNRIPFARVCFFFSHALALWLALAWVTPAWSAPKTRARLLLSAETARPGEVVWAGLQMDMPAGWHTYWRNGGEAGQPTEIAWTLPDGVTAGEINWPLPEKETDTIGDFSLVTYIYTNTTVLLVPLTVDKAAKAGPLTLSANAKWMECSDICVPTGMVVTATLTVGEESKPSVDAATITAWRNKVPQTNAMVDAAAFWEAIGPKTNARGLVIEWKTNVANADFYPFATTNFEMAGKTETLAAPAGTIRLRKIVKNEGEWPQTIDGVLTGGTEPAGRFGLEAHLTIQAGLPAAAASPVKNAGSILPMLLLAFLGGLILNIMPCVLPVIALKILGFVSQAKEEPRRVRQLGAVYGVGVLISFLALAGLAIGVQRAGGVANWGDAFRNPHFQVAFTILMTLIALNLFGVFEITLSGKALGAASELSGRAGFSGAFFNGVLATLLATPCTAPFLGVALAFAFTQSPAVVLLVFLAAGFGLAFPFVVICWNPRLLKLLPKPGAWMERFKNAMGFPMLATAVWLLWVSSTTEEDQLWLGLFLVVMAFAAWIWGQFVQRGTRRKFLAAVICFVVLGFDYGVILKAGNTEIEWKPWSPEAVAQAQHEGHPVLVDFTAKSCLTCNLNLGSSIEIDKTRAKLKRIGAVMLKADYTREDPTIGRELHRFNAAGVPLVLVYSKDVAQEPQVLPTILTPAIVLDALDKAVK